MNHPQPSLKIIVLVTLLIVATGVVLVAAKESHETKGAGLEEPVQIKGDSVTLNADLIGPWRLEGLARIDGDSVTSNADLIGPWRWEEPARIKEDGAP